MFLRPSPGIVMVALISSPSPFTSAAPKGGHLLIYYTYAHVACRVGPDTAGKGAAVRAQSRLPQRMRPADVSRGRARTQTVA